MRAQDMQLIKFLRAKSAVRAQLLPEFFLTLHESGFYWLIVNVGDSRVYRHRAGSLQQITVDHTLRNEMLISGVMAADDPRLPAGNVITRALGSGSDLLDTWLLPLTVGERLLICSDGLTDTLSEAELLKGLQQKTAERASDYLLTAALALSPRDNVTLIVVDVHDAGGLGAADIAADVQRGSEKEMLSGKSAVRVAAETQFSSTATADITEVVAEAQHNTNKL